MGTLDGKRIIVAGGGGEQGRAATALLTREGGHVVVADLSISLAQASAAQADGQPGSATAVQLDVTDPASWAACIDHCRATLGGLDGLVNYAAILSRGGIEQTDDAIWDQTLRVNAKGAWYGIRAAIALMREGGGGAIVNVGSVDGLVGRASNTAYQASKGALRLLGLSAATEYAAAGIRVNNVHPGPMAVRMQQVVGVQATPEEVAGLEARLTAQIPMGRLGKAQDIAWAVRFLLSDESAFVTGVDFPVDGGLTAQ
ncbi:MAG: SDR family NAD(P)-dependent oxidoreductase [Beutenbergiaceae bacterium]